MYTFGAATLFKTISWSTIRRQKLQIKQIAQTSSNEILGITEQYMFDTLLEKCMVSGDRLYDVGHQICSKLYYDKQANKSSTSSSATVTDPDEITAAIYEDITHPDVSSQDTIRSVGRICCDSEAKVDLKSTILVGTDDSRLRTAYLNFSKLNSFALFAGQTVVVEGINPRGDTIYLNEIFSERQLTYSDPPKITDPINMVIASGPYTLDDDLTYETLLDLIRYCKEHNPDVLIMVGPFLDAEHSLIVDGVLTETFSSFFEKIIFQVMDAVE